MKNYYFTAPVQRELFNKNLFDEKEASDFGEKEVKRLTKEDKEQKYLYGYEVTKNGSYKALYITSCKKLSDGYSLKEIDELSTNVDNEKYFKDKKIVISYKNDKTIKNLPIILNNDKKYIKPMYIEKELQDLIFGDDINFINELIKKHQNYPHLSEYLVTLKKILEQRSFNNKMTMSIHDTTFYLFYRLIMDSANSSYINGSDLRIEYNYNSMRKFGLFIRDYCKEKEKILEEKNYEDTRKSKPLTLTLKPDGLDQIKMEGF